MIAFRISGSYADPRAVQQPFSVEIAADDEAAAREKLISTFGSRHKLKREQISIAKIEEVPKDQIVSHLVKYQAGE